ncbi:MAG: AAA family ATPase [Candidatus Saccharibacteria bacterium]|nr:AAA family ATPase [Candidatus Saccharibacteria bacterium]
MPNLGEAGKCEAPRYLTLDEHGKSRFDGLDGELAGRLAQGLGDYLKEYHVENKAERLVFAEIKSGFEVVQAARDELYKNALLAIKDGGPAPEEIKFYQEQIKWAQDELTKITERYSAEETLLGRAAFDKQCLESRGIIFTDSMLANTERLINNVIEGRPTMLQGDKGIAKTQIVKYLSRLVAPDKEPLIISVDGDTMAHAFTGRYTQDEETGRVMLEDSKLITAAREGRPLLIDEVNFGDTSVMATLHDILLKKPGDTIITETGEVVKIQPGFIICMTANEGDRYQNRIDLDSAFKDRLDVIHFDYPDTSTKPHIDDMPETLRLAFAAAVDTDGELSKYVEIDDLMKLARLAHVSQQLYTQPAQNVTAVMSSIHVPSQNALTGLIDERPVMSNCISPRDMIGTILRVASGRLIDVTLLGEIDMLLGKLDKDGENYNRNVLMALYGKMGK